MHGRGLSAWQYCSAARTQQMTALRATGLPDFHTLAIVCCITLGLAVVGRQHCGRCDALLLSPGIAQHLP